MSDLVKYVKPNGTVVEINQAPATLAKAKELGWLPEAEAKKKSGK